ncbi:MAG TPA: peptidoglycan-binding domain-containing protein, partial [Candidatus Paceibacterota bacterium]
MNSSAPSTNSPTGSGGSTDTTNSSGSTSSTGAGSSGGGSSSGVNTTNNTPSPSTGTSSTTTSSGALNASSTASLLSSGPLATSSLDVGSSGPDVAKLQALLATNSSIYPEGLVTGYYGALTQQAVERFQTAFGLPAVGRVGPLTLKKLNGILAMSTPVIDIDAPVISGVSASAVDGTATITWTTDELARGRVFYGPTPLVNQGSTVSGTAAPTINGTVAQEAFFKTDHSVTLNNLNSNSTYYFIVASA